MASKPRFFNDRYIYHIYNCGTGKQKIFDNYREYEKFVEIISYYRYEQPLRLSYYQRLPQHLKLEYAKQNPKGKEKERIQFLAYCLMPNHFHFLVKPCRTTNLKDVISDISNSYTKYFNTKNKHVGRILQGPFKSKEIRDNGSVLNVSRYIHLNPFKSSKTNPQRNSEMIISYPYSSYVCWHQSKANSIISQVLLGEWLQIASGSEKYTEFVNAGVNKPIQVGIEKTVIEESVD